MNYDVTNLHHFALIEFYLRLINRRAGIFRFKPLFSNTDSSFTNNEKKRYLGKTTQQATYILVVGGNEEMGSVQMGCCDELYLSNLCCYL